MKEYLKQLLLPLSVILFFSSGGLFYLWWNYPNAFHWVMTGIGILSLVAFLGALIYMVYDFFDRMFHHRRMRERNQKLEETELGLKQQELETNQKTPLIIKANHSEQVFIQRADGTFYSAHLPDGMTPEQYQAWQLWQASKGGSIKSLIDPVNNEPVALPEPKVELPKHIDLYNILNNNPHLPNPQHIILGVFWDAEKGKLAILTIPLHRIVHLGVAGTTGFGKSIMIRNITYQLSLCDNVKLVLIDTEETTFTPFVHLDRRKLLYPICGEHSKILPILDDLERIKGERKKLFKDYPQVEKLEDYNAIAPEPLPFIVVVIDEMDGIMGDKDILPKLELLGQKTRKYGIYLILGGTDWKIDKMSSQLRNNIVTRIQFKAMSDQQSKMMVGTTEGVDLDIEGRAIARVAGLGLTYIQTPYIDKATAIANLQRLYSGGTNQPTDPMIIDYDHYRQQTQKLPKINIESVRKATLELYKQDNKMPSASAVCRKLGVPVKGDNTKLVQSYWEQLQAMSKVR